MADQLTDAEITRALDIARQLVAAGVPVFAAAPDSSRTGEFHLPKAWQQWRPNPAAVDQWRPGWALGAVCGHLLDVLDVDPRNGGDVSATGLQEAGIWPQTYGLAATPSGGTHHPIAPLRVAKSEPAPGIDLQSGKPDGTGRGFVYISPTVRPSKVDGQWRPYRWLIEPDLAKLAESADVDQSGAAIAEMVEAKRRPKTPPAASSMFTAPGAARPAGGDLVRARVDQLAAELAAASEGSGNKEATRVGFMVGQYVGAGQITLDEASRRLHAAFTGWRWRDDASRDGVYMSLQRALEDGTKQPRPWTAATGGVGQDQMIGDILGTNQPAAGPPGPPPNHLFPRWFEGHWYDGDGNQYVPPAAGRQLVAVRASEITMRAVRWLWETTTTEAFSAPGGRGMAQWLPLGGLCLLGGREGIGKTTWAYRIAAQVTTGTLPGSFHGQPRAVIVAATEDDWARTIVPRLVAAGADLTQVIRVDAEEGGYVTGLTLPADIVALKELCDQEGAALIVLDPLMGTISGKLDSHKDHEVRIALEPLSRLAHETQLTILGLIHVNKSQGSDLLSRLMASRAFSAVARAVLFAVKEEPEPSAEETDRETFLLGQAKNNLAARVPYSVKYHIEGVEVGRDDELGVPIWSSRVVVDGIEGQRIDELVSGQENRAPQRETVSDRAEKWLREYLTGKGAVPSETVKAAGKVAGFNDRTLKRVLADVGVRVVPIEGTNNKTAWTLTAGENAVLTDPVVPSDPTVPAVPTKQSGTKRGVGTVGTTGQTPREAVPTPLAGCRGCGQRLLTAASIERGICVRCAPVHDGGAA